MSLVRSLDQKADVFTKAVAGPLWVNAMKLMALVRECTVISSSQAGLKLTIGLSQASCQTATPGIRTGYKKRQKRKLQRVPLYSKEWFLSIST